MTNIIARIKEEKPLVHHITNYVTTNESANVTLYWGGLPVMAHFKEEVAAMVESAAALVLNIGVLDDEQVEAMIRAGKKANQLEIPVILDPVGAGATDIRTDVAKELMSELDLAVIKGNQGEITVLSGGKAEMSGVESIGEYSKIEQDALNLAQQQDVVVVVSGAEDIVTDGQEVKRINRGHPLMGQVVGTGCMLSSTLGVFCGVEKDYLAASIAAVTAYGIAGEKASQEAERPASYKIALQDNISMVNDDDLIDL
ncbi:hydroxyethylthiazole kinase [Halanaerobacter jeridensis]|uniref:Hydroxyethylthiazole kinase n=1 Tax=Halanaerobacter jeridensis TaxID=706427 RepID=A0A938XWB4_9FIRM|nr:hydroxyethylthiazole kinase [Halanaerobacter jeridensis]MBM7558019.1 hydroxyethylthiazole kinase [Halanaerobacter jeridensis]